MPVAVNVPFHMRRITAGLKTVNVEGSTVAECILDLVRRYPAIRPELLDADGHLISHATIWVNRKGIPPENQWHHATSSGDEIDILYLYAGG